MTQESEDSDFLEHPCIDCETMNLGKTMWHCGQCRGKLCQNCDGRHIGCSYDGMVCRGCFDAVYHNRPRYCTDKSCGSCHNKSPQHKAKLRRRQDALAAFEKSFDREKWKAEHRPIDYPSVHKGKYLIDLFFIQRGYIEWMIDSEKHSYHGPKAPTFPDFVAEAKELMAAATRSRTQPCRVAKSKVVKHCSVLVVLQNANPEGDLSFRDNRRHILQASHQQATV
jgi:hypothetical protein